MPAPSSACGHLEQIKTIQPSGPGCEDCSAIGATWAHLRLCMTCGHVGCCDNSANRHATGHYHATSHPIIRSYEPDEDWWWCYADELSFDVEGAGPAPSHP